MNCLCLNRGHHLHIYKQSIVHKAPVPDGGICRPLRNGNIAPLGGTRPLGIA